MQVSSQATSRVARLKYLRGGVRGNQRVGAGGEHRGVQTAANVGSLGTVLSGKTSQEERNLGRFGVASNTDESASEGGLKLVRVLDE